MPLMPAICTQCKGALTVDPKEKSGVCPYCGTTFLNQDVINNYNITNVQNNVTNIGNLHADVVNVQDSKSADNLYKKAVTYLNFKDFNAAFTAFDEMTKTYPYDHRGWKGMMLAGTNNLDKKFFKTHETVNTLKYYYDYYQKAKLNSGLIIENDPTDKYVEVAENYLQDNFKAARAAIKIFYDVQIANMEKTYAEKNTPEKRAARIAEAKESLPRSIKGRKKELGKGVDLLLKIAIIISILVVIAIPIMITIAFSLTGDSSELNVYQPQGYEILLFGIESLEVRFDYLKHAMIAGTLFYTFVAAFIMSIFVLLVAIFRAAIIKRRENNGYASSWDFSVEYFEEIINGIKFVKEREELDKEINKLRLKMQAEIDNIK